MNWNIGKAALMIALADFQGHDQLIRDITNQGFRVCVGKVGSMELPKIIAAVETTSRREGMIDDTYRSQHAIYHATVDALQGLARGPVEIGNLLRTVGLKFAVVIGPRNAASPDGLWVAVAMYGMMGAPIKGHEHEVCGLGINHL